MTVAVLILERYYRSLLSNQTLFGGFTIKEAQQPQLSALTSNRRWYNTENPRVRDPSQVNPIVIVNMLCLTPAGWAQVPAAMTPETVVARVDGKHIIAGELMMVLQMSPPETQKSLLNDGKAFASKPATTSEHPQRRDLASAKLIHYP